MLINKIYATKIMCREIYEVNIFPNQRGVKYHGRKIDIIEFMPCTYPTLVFSLFTRRKSIREKRAVYYPQSKKRMMFLSKWGDFYLKRGDFCPVFYDKNF